MVHTLTTWNILDHFQRMASLLFILDWPRLRISSSILFIFRWVLAYLANSSTAEMPAISFFNSLNWSRSLFSWSVALNMMGKALTIKVLDLNNWKLNYNLFITHCRAFGKRDPMKTQPTINQNVIFCQKTKISTAKISSANGYRFYFF